MTGDAPHSVSLRARGGRRGRRVRRGLLRQHRPDEAAALGGPRRGALAPTAGRLRRQGHLMLTTEGPRAARLAAETLQALAAVELDAGEAEVAARLRGAAPTLLVAGDK